MAARRPTCAVLVKYGANIGRSFVTPCSFPWTFVLIGPMRWCTSARTLHALHKVCSRRPCWRSPTIKDICINIKHISQRKIILSFRSSKLATVNTLCKRDSFSHLCVVVTASTSNYSYSVVLCFIGLLLTLCLQQPIVAVSGTSEAGAPRGRTNHSPERRQPIRWRPLPFHSHEREQSNGNWSERRWG